MKLFEFFGKIDHDIENTDDQNRIGINKEEEAKLADDVFWFILDDDDLHKQYFMPIARKLKKIYDSESKLDDIHDWKSWAKMVNNGCMKYYQEHALKDDPNDIFDKKFRMELCKKLTNHYHDDIIKGEYNLGL